MSDGMSSDSSHDTTEDRLDMLDRRVFRRFLRFADVLEHRVGGDHTTPEDSRVLAQLAATLTLATAVEHLIVAVDEACPTPAAGH